MGLISYTPIADGTTAVASQVNTPLQTIYNEFNGNISAANLAANAVISSKLDPTVNPETRMTEQLFDHVGNGLLWTIVSGLNGTMSVGVVYINGIRYPIGAIASRAFTPSKDTYVDVNNSSTIVYTEVANNASSPSLAASSVRLAIGITSGAAITSFNTGSEAAAAPVVSSITLTVTDSLGNLIYPLDPLRKVLGLRRITASATQTITSATQVVGLTCPVNVPTNRKVEIEVFGRAFYTGVNNVGANVTIWDGTVGSGTQLAQALAQAATATTAEPCICKSVTTPAATAKTYNVGLHPTSAATATLEAAATAPAYIKVTLL